MSNLHFTKRQLFILCFCILNIFVLSCKNVDIDPKQQNNESRIANTKQWFEKKVLNVAAARKNGGFALDDVEIDWNNVKINEAKSGKDYFMIPLKHQQFIDVSSGHEVKTPPMKLIIREDEKGEKVAYILQVIPDDDSDEAKKKPFSGTIRMTTWKGTLVKGWKIKNGKVINRFTSKNTLNIIKNGRIAYGEIPDCVEDTYTDYVFECFFSAVVTCPIPRPPFQEIKVYGSYFYSYDKNGCTSPPSMYFGGCSSPEWDLVEENDYSLSYIVTTCDGINIDEWAGYGSFEEYACEMYGTYCNEPSYEPSCGYGFIKDAYGNCVYCPNGGRCGDNTGTTDENELTNKIEDNFTDPCFSNTLQDLRNNNWKTTATEILANFDASSSLNLIFENLNLGDAALDGDHHRLNANNYNVTLNNEALKGASKEYIAVTMMHEIIHAQLSAQGKMGNLLNHIEMANSYINPMARALMFIYLLNETDAKALAWGGLHETTAWNQLTESERTNITLINSKYKNLNGTRQNSPGTHCN
ncbi:hypothetical protein VB776_24330 [Arcicella sp. DC2W]|uniref:SprT-like domain-containing protein n=1 Tax=Arcicella gelida TaxID=2984195 RepID=A0ABU5SC97_9BACT|nr:hypothetical protein [Arcicella sp. DC2W]MEA5406089.1 hypothetical protein [Arcicella sp. DC2W]